MKIELDLNTDGLYTIQAYSQGQFIIDKTVYRHSLILAPNEIIELPDLKGIQNLNETILEQTISREPEIVIIGTGRSLIFPENELLQPLSERYIGTEIMDSGAACRSYNFLVGEGRKVIAILISIDDE
jgi:uncharacterized protein